MRAFASIGDIERRAAGGVGSGCSSTCTIEEGYTCEGDFDETSVRTLV
ncbi:hypothetical protein [Haliangium ochraceum]|uniref:Uncharacterized protein n=1 Tax=Haliangium ochraceum (strain DSM 14365 / JCM 11303 / SMP-2) TaxID=502025 RepID=D0LK48_HALO1|nr:hypothetical protein Hoch_0441 [Haliangium ochraceum DSM 14365]